MTCKEKEVIWGLCLSSRRTELPEGWEGGTGSCVIPLAGAQCSGLCLRPSRTHTGSRQQRYVEEGSGNWKDIWANWHVGLLQSLCAWGGSSLGWDGSQEGSKRRSPWRPEDDAEITPSPYCQAAVRSWTFAHRWSTRERHEEGGGFFQGRVWNTGSPEQSPYLPLLLSPLANCQPSTGFSQKSKFSNWQKLICCAIWVH